MTFTTEFEFDETVRIKPIDREGRIMSFNADKFGVSYYVRYFDTGLVPQNAYFGGWELERPPQKSSIGIVTAA
jgi:hypothetical protein